VGDDRDLNLVVHVGSDTMYNKTAKVDYDAEEALPYYARHHRHPEAVAQEHQRPVIRHVL
jgi:hypothetical protein